MKTEPSEEQKTHQSRGGRQPVRRRKTSASEEEEDTPALFFMSRFNFQSWMFPPGGADERDRPPSMLNRHSWLYSSERITL